MIDFDSADVAGTFEYIEAKIRRDAEGTTFGGDFEWLCQWFLENAPRYRGQFDQVWLWKDWPERWGRMRESTSLLARERGNCGPFRPRRIIPTERSPSEKSIHFCLNRIVRSLPFDC